MNANTSPSPLAPVDVDKVLRFKWGADEYVRHDDHAAAVAQLAADLATAREEVARWQKSFDGHVYVSNDEWADKCAEVINARSTAHELRQRLAAAEADAARYRHLRTYCSRQWVDNNTKQPAGSDISFDAATYDLDAAIDAAIQQRSGHGD